MREIEQKNREEENSKTSNAGGITNRRRWLNELEIAMDTFPSHFSIKVVSPFHQSVMQHFSENSIGKLYIDERERKQKHSI